jgi:hypothetical protein
MNHSTPYTTIAAARIISLNEALKQYKTPGVSEYMLEGLKGDLYVFDEDAHFESLNLDELFYTEGRCGVLFRGNLTVDTYLIQPETDYGPFVLVLGNVIAKNIFMGGGYTRIEGNVTVEQTLFAGCYNHGMSDIDGIIAAEIILSQDHSFNFKAANVKKGIWLVDSDLNDMPPHDPADVLNKGYWDKYDECLKSENIVKAIKKGQSIIKPAAAVSPIIKRLEKAAQSKNKRADLSNLKLKTLPKELFELKDLQRLDLSGNPVAITGDELTALQQLHTIELTSCQLEEVPAVLAKMTSLETLSLSYNNISTLPDSFSALHNLKKLLLYNCQLKAVPAVLKTLPKLEVLNIDYQQDDALLTVDEGFSTLKELQLRGDLRTALPKLEQLTMTRRAMIELPPTLFASKKLKKLHVSAAVNLVGLPDEFVAFKQLEEISLTLHRNFQNIKVLAHLPKLKTVWVKFYDDGIPKQFFELLDIPQWSELYINGMPDDRSIAARILSRPNLKKLEKYSSFGTETIDIATARKWLGINI